MARIFFFENFLQDFSPFSPNEYSKLQCCCSNRRRQFSIGSWYFVDHPSARRTLALALFMKWDHSPPLVSFWLHQSTWYLCNYVVLLCVKIDTIFSLLAFKFVGLTIRPCRIFDKFHVCIWVVASFTLKIAMILPKSLWKRVIVKQTLVSESHDSHDNP